MANEIESQIQGACSGYNGGAVFKLINGQVWQQKVYLYVYQYTYRPPVRIFEKDGETLLQIEGMEDAVPVTQVSIVQEGTIVSDFKGFTQDVKFEFDNGRIWVPAEYKYSYHYAYRPHALVINGINGLELFVEGMSETIRVRRGN